MSSREKDSSDFDLEQFIDLFDTALASDNPAVKRALKNLLMIATLVDSDLTPEQRVKGPLRRLVEDMQNLGRRMSQLEHESLQKTYTRTMPSTGIGGWPLGGGVTTTPYVPSPYTTTGTGGSGFPPGTIIGNAGNGYTLSKDDVADITNQMIHAKYEAMLSKWEARGD